MRNIKEDEKGISYDLYCKGYNNCLDELQKGNI